MRVCFIVPIIAGGLFAALGGASAALAQQPTAPPAVVPVQVPVQVPILAPVTVTLTTGPVEAKFMDFAKALPAQPLIGFEPLALQAAMDSPTTDNAMAARIRSAYKELVSQRPENEPVWRDGLNPIVWMARARGGTAAWWPGFKALPPTARTFTDMFPVYYDSFTPPNSKYARAKQLNNDALDAFFIGNDIGRAVHLLENAWSAAGPYDDKENPSRYSFAPYNAAVFQMVQQNPKEAVLYFNDALTTKPGPGIQDHAAYFRQNLRKQALLLLRQDGSQRRIYVEAIDAAWAMVNAGQLYAAAIFAGQAAAIDKDEEWPDAHVVVAMICAVQNRPADTTLWLQYGLERSKGAAGRIVGGALRDVRAAAASPPAVPPAAPPAVPPAAPPAAPPASPPAVPPVTPPGTTAPPTNPPAKQ